RRNTDSTIIWPGSQKMHGTKTGLFTEVTGKEQQKFLLQNHLMIKISILMHNHLLEAYLLSR
ncbi:hypothetical protein, partial [Klebsiella variicola]|uniref:hypothetical protein n=1 Tax=Klebsiella variicola TaxID=244366 RepID=UPI001C63ED38